MMAQDKLKTFVDRRGSRWDASMEGHDFNLSSPGSLNTQLTHGVAEGSKTILFVDPWTSASIEGDKGFPAPDPNLKVIWDANHPEWCSYGRPFRGPEIKAYIDAAVRRVQLCNLAGIMLDNHAKVHPWWLTSGTDPEVYYKIHGRREWLTRLRMIWMEGYARHQLKGKLVLTNGDPYLNLNRWWETVCRNEYRWDRAMNKSNEGDWVWCNSGREVQWYATIREFGQKGCVIGCGYPDGDNSDPPTRKQMEEWYHDLR